MKDFEFSRAQSFCFGGFVKDFEFSFFLSLLPFSFLMFFSWGD